MARPRFSKLDEATRRRIIETAAAEFSACGYEGASLNRIIERIGISKGSFYYYFDDKADLFGTVLEAVWREFIPAEEFDVESLDGETFWPTLRAWVRGVHKRARSKPWLIPVSRLFYHPPADPDVAAMVGEKLSEAMALQEVFMRRGQEVGMVRTDLPRELLMSILAAADMAADHWMLDNWESYPPEELEAISERYLDLLEGALRPAHEGR